VAHKKGRGIANGRCPFFYECDNCKTVLEPKEGDCCVYCSYGTCFLPSIQKTKFVMIQVVATRKIFNLGLLTIIQKLHLQLIQY